LLLGAKDATIESFIQRITTELGDDYFDNARSTAKDADGQREDVFRYLKGKKARHRLLAEWLPVDEIALPVRQLLGGLNSLIRGKDMGKTVQLGT
jgi:hypothetical protein